MGLSDDLSQGGNLPRSSKQDDVAVLSRRILTKVSEAIIVLKKNSRPQLAA